MEKGTMTAKKKHTTNGVGEVNHEVIAWALAGALLAYGDGPKAFDIIDTCDKLGAEMGDTEVYDLRAEAMIRNLLDAHEACAYDLDGQNRRTGRKFYARLVELAGGPEGSHEPKGKDSCAWLCWTARRLRAALTTTIRESHTEEEYTAFGKPRMELGVLFHVVQGATWREFDTPAVLQMLGPLVAAGQRRGFYTRPTGRKGGRVMPKRDTPASIKGRNPLTHEEAAQLAYGLVDMAHGEQVAQLLLLVHAFTYCDADERESMSSEIEERLVPWLDGADELRHAAMRREVEALRKGRA
jgi:hypothetical protein